jgi:hypothetical protein
MVRNTGTLPMRKRIITAENASLEPDSRLLLFIVTLGIESLSVGFQTFAIRLRHIFGSLLQSLDEAGRILGFCKLFDGFSDITGARVVGTSPLRVATGGIWSLTPTIEAVSPSVERLSGYPVRMTEGEFKGKPSAAIQN